MSSISGSFLTAVYVLGPLLVSTVFGAGPEFCEQSWIYNDLMMEQHFEAQYDDIMKTVKVDCHVTCILTFKHNYSWHRNWEWGVKKTSLLSPRTTKLWRGYRVCPVRMYVSTYVRSFVCSPALATSFIIQFRYNFTQVLDMTIPRTSSRFSMIGSRSRSQWLFLEKLCHHPSAFIY